jgi:membrane protein DedA with SNARE-associated domain
MSADQVTHLLLAYRYWLLIPLSFLEGPVVAFVAGTLAAVGYFNLYVLGILFFIRDVGLDGVYYAIGHFGGRTRFAKRMLAKIGITDDHLGRVRETWERRPFMTMFIGKLSYGIASAFIVVAGMVKMPLRLFFRYGALVAIAQYGPLLLAGYFLGTSIARDAALAIEYAQYVFLFGGIVLFVYYTISLRMRARLLQQDGDIERLPADS